MTITYINPFNKLQLTPNKGGFTDEEGTLFNVENGVLKFVKDDNYTSNFGFQWNKFAKTQLDRHHSSVDQSKKRFFAVTQWEEGGLENENILEVGSGAGRFSQVILKHTKANLYTVDYSNAVEANYKNNGPHPRLHIFQASIYELPFAPNQFDKVVCFGVLQHTPDFEQSIKCLAEMVKPGGELIVDFYPIRGWWTKIHAKYLLRPWTRRMSHEQLLELIEKNADWMIRFYKRLDKVGLHIFTRFLPICDIKNTLPKNLTTEQLREWVILDTFDMYSPEYDSPQSLSTVENWFEQNNLANINAAYIQFENNSISSVRALKPN
ncbi:MAG: class I SAM-dependent methyltransferase [Cyclobacteriaceae bacterium]